MASNTGNKRIAIKHVRDGIKAKYPEKIECAICGGKADQDLEGHHYATLSLVFEKYCRDNNITVKTDEDVLNMRSKFYEDNWFEVVDDMVTLCATHHKALHRVYGKQPPLATANKQKNWVERQALKNNGLEDTDVTSSNNNSRFGQFISLTRVDFASLIPKKKGI